MNTKWIGAILVIAASGGFGLHMTALHLDGVHTLTQLIRSLEYMECALQYQLTPLPELCEHAGTAASGKVRRIYLELASQLRSQSYGEVQTVMLNILYRQKDLSYIEKRLFRFLGASLGCFDLPGQVQGLQHVREECNWELELLKSNQKERLRNYQTLGLCAGTALVILFI